MSTRESGTTWSWASELNTGISAIDDEHQKLLQLIYQSHLLAKEGGSTSLLLEHTRNLIVCTASYFHREESIMRAVNHPALEPIVSAQVKIMQDLQHDFNICPFNNESIGEFIDLLKESLVAHIQLENKNFSAFNNNVNDKIKTVLSRAEPPGSCQHRQYLYRR